MSDNDIFFELTAIAARLGDIHLNVYPGASHIYDRMFPAKVKFFDNKLYLTAFQEGFEHLRPYLLREIVAVNGVDIAYLERKIESVSNPANRWYSRETFTVCMFLQQFGRFIYEPANRTGIVHHSKRHIDAPSIFRLDILCLDGRDHCGRAYRTVLLFFCLFRRCGE